MEEIEAKLKDRFYRKFTFGMDYKSNKTFPSNFCKIKFFLLRPLQVRHPLSRILSAYLDKFDSRNTVVAEYYMRWFGRFIIKNYQGGKHNPIDQNYKGIII